ELTLRAKAEERRLHEAERDKLDGQLRTIEKKATASESRAAKADVTPPEKGGGPNTAANARVEAAAARPAAGALTPTRDAAKQAAEELEAPITQLTQELTDGRAELVQKRKDLVEAEALHKKTLVDLEQQRQAAGAERDAAEREITQRFVHLGTIL